MLEIIPFLGFNTTKFSKQLKNKKVINYVNKKVTKTFHRVIINGVKEFI